MGRIRKRSGPGRPPAKDALGRFVFALRELNSKISKIKLRGRKNYYRYSDVQGVFGRQEGRCYYCGWVLQPTGYTLNSVRFVHRIRIQTGGQVHESNLIAVCERHAKERDHPAPQPQVRVIDFNTFGDLVVQLVWSTLSEDELRITYFKRSIDVALAQFVQEMYAIPIGLEESMPPPVEYAANVSEHVLDIIHKLSEGFEEIAYTREYRPDHRIVKSRLSQEETV